MKSRTNRTSPKRKTHRKSKGGRNIRLGAYTSYQDTLSTEFINQARQYILDEAEEERRIQLLLNIYNERIHRINNIVRRIDEHMPRDIISSELKEIETLVIEANRVAEAVHDFRLREYEHMVGELEKISIYVWDTRRHFRIR